MIADTPEAEDILKYFRQDNLHDLALIVEDHELWVPRQSLALYSPVFNEMLYGQFKESRENKVNLPEKKYVDVLEFACCLFPCPNVKKVNGTNVDCLLSFSDEYNVYDLRKRCEDYLSLQLFEQSSATNDDKLLDLLVLACKHKLLSVIKTSMPRAALLPLDEVKARKHDLPQIVLTTLYEMKLDLVEKRERSEHRWSGNVNLNGPNPIFCESCGSRITKTCQRCRQVVCQSCATSESRLTSCPICAACGNYFPLATLTSGASTGASSSSTNRLSQAIRGACNNIGSATPGVCKCILTFDDEMAARIVANC